MFDHGATQDEVFMARAKYVPAITSAVGHVAVDDTVVTENHDLAILDGAGALHSGWGRPVSGSSLVWKHSDMKDVAFGYVHLLYEDRSSCQLANWQTRKLPNPGGISAILSKLPRAARANDDVKENSR